MPECATATNSGPGPTTAPTRKPAASRRDAGFTLLEVLVVLVILGLIAAVFAGPRVFSYLSRAKGEAATVQAEQISAALDLFRLDIGRYPAEEEGLEVLVIDPGSVPGWNGPYLRKAETIKDPWGRTFGYRIPGDHGEYDLFSLGADNAEGGEGADADITSW